MSAALRGTGTPRVKEESVPAPSRSDDLAEREARAQRGIVAFAEELRAIRDERLYPNAKQKDAWKDYCKSRWSMSKQYIDGVIRAAPVLKRAEGNHGFLPVTYAAAVATLPEEVQDAILGDNPAARKRPDVIAKAKAARAVTVPEGMGKEEAIRRQLEAVSKAKAPHKKSKRKRTTEFDSEFYDAATENSARPRSPITIRKASGRSV